MSRLTISQRRAVWAYIFLFVPLIFFIFIRIVPTLSAFNISLHEWNPLAPEQEFVGLANYQQLWEDLLDSRSPTHHAFVNTLKYVLIGMPLQLVIALIIA
ncbi:MAG: sugar ABC transporter permease, partial [Anaerolineaceae bacterium]